MNQECKATRYHFRESYFQIGMTWRSNIDPPKWCFQWDVEEEASGAHEYREIILQQSVTMLAYMDRTTNTSSVSPGVAEPRMLLGFNVNDLTIVIGAAIAVLIQPLMVFNFGP
ncbi:uncharacterized protein CEXT_314421 [Caerostris extrusa]|uniref:Uncharacterized protein n=1 Tax=Caerostris extrusa TaxID=172846 RepID=A0AAV4RG17_CAEEX|nr:uncharacterized protein CEXT_314421 [Caerostris extrusa]